MAFQACQKFLVVSFIVFFARILGFLFEPFFLQGFLSPDPARVGTQHTVGPTAVHAVVLAVAMIFSGCDAMCSGYAHLFQRGRSVFSDTTAVFDLV
jgi:hypothetical protein